MSRRKRTRRRPSARATPSRRARTQRASAGTPSRPASASGPPAGQQKAAPESGPAPRSPAIPKGVNPEKAPVSPAPPPVSNPPALSDPAIASDPDAVPTLQAPDLPPPAEAGVSIIERLTSGDGWIPIPLEDLLQQLQSAPETLETPREPSAWMTVPLAAVLAGLAIGWQWFGFRMLASAVLDPLPGTTTMLAVIALLAAMAGVWLPLKVLRILDGRLERRPSKEAEDTPVRPRPRAADQNVSRGSGPQVPGAANTSGAHVYAKDRNRTTSLDPVKRGLARLIHDRDEPLLWTAVAVLASVAGAAALLTLAASEPLTRLYQILLERFFWTNVTLTLLEWGGTAIAAGPLWLLNGLLVMSIVLAAVRRWPVSLTGAAVGMGLMVGWVLADVSHHYWTDNGLSCEQQIMLGILPIFLLAGLAVLIAHDLTAAGPHCEEDHDAAAHVSDSNDRLIRPALLVWGIGLALAGTGLMSCVGAEPAMSGPHTARGGAGHVLLVLLGYALAWLNIRRRTLRGEGCAMALWLAGMGAGAAATLCAFAPASLPDAVKVAALAMPAGCALAYIQTAWLARARGQGAGLAQLAGGVLGGLAIGLSMGRWIVLPLLGPIGSMAAGALTWLAFAGLSHIFVRDATGAHHQRLALAFASLAGAIAVLPLDVRHWTAAQAARSVQAGWDVDAAWLIAQSPGRARRFCIIEPGLNGFAEGATAMTTLAYPLPPSAYGDLNHGRRADFPNACRALRLEHNTYDLVYQRGPLVASGGRYFGYSAEWLGKLARHRAAGGRVILDMLLAGHTGASAATVAYTFERAMNEPCFWKITWQNGRKVLRLCTSAGTDRPAAGPAAGGWLPVSQLLTEKEFVSIHSARRDSISRTQYARSSNAAEPPLLEALTRSPEHVARSLP